jgi:hypothetical protein
MHAVIFPAPRSDAHSLRQSAIRKRSPLSDPPSDRYSGRPDGSIGAHRAWVGYGDLHVRNIGDGSPEGLPVRADPEDRFDEQPIVAVASFGIARLLQLLRRSSPTRRRS